MITAPRTKEPGSFPGWGTVKGMIRHIEIHPKETYAIYVIEESPGYRDIRFKRRKYRIFFPWLYFFVKVLKTCETDDEKLCVFVSKKQIKDLDEKSLLFAPFPSSMGGGMICMPDSRNKTEKPIDTALDVICEFWKSNSNELDADGQNLVPPNLTKGTVALKLGSVYGIWSRMTPDQAINIEFEKPDQNSIREQVKRCF